jgi:large subunit ribosomal protein L13
MQKTYIQKPAEVKRAWHLVDAKDQVLGQVATLIAKKLMGKDKVTFTPNVDAGDHVVVINATQVVVTGAKSQRKMYYRHSHFPGGIKGSNFEDLLASKPTEVIQRAVFNMLPKNKLRADRMARLKIYQGAEHKHQSQLGK